MSTWHRVFGSSGAEPDPGELLRLVFGLVGATGNFGGDEAGWFHAEFAWDGVAPLEIERFQSTEKGLRAELNSWSAWVETHEELPGRAALMERFIQAQQLFTLRGGDERVRRAATRHLANATNGLYQIDGEGLYDLAGTLLLPDAAALNPNEQIP